MQAPTLARFARRDLISSLLVSRRLRDVCAVAEWVRFLAEWLVLVPAARYLPLRAALAVADAIGTVDSMVPTQTRRELQEEMARLGVPEDDVPRLVRARMVMRRRDLAWLERMGRGREYLDDWTVVESNAGPVHDLIRAQRSFIVAGGHFTKAATKLRFKIIPPHGASVTAAKTPFEFSPRKLRQRLMSDVEGRARAGLLREHRTRSVEVEHAPGGARSNVQDQVLADLAEPGTVTQILVDAYWDRPRAHRRDFGGQINRGFARGAPRIARLAQCPIVPFVAVFGSGERTVQIDWGDPIEPAAPDNAQSDDATVDRALDFLEAGIRRYPAQYVD